MSYIKRMGAVILNAAALLLIIVLNQFLPRNTLVTVMTDELLDPRVTSSGAM